MAGANILFGLHVREASKGFLISLRASNRYSPRYLESLELALALLASYADENHWPAVAGITTAHLEEYLAYVQDRPRWFGVRGQGSKPSQSTVETNYRRLKRFFNWLMERGHTEDNPLGPIPHPHVDERVIATVSEREARNLLKLVDPRHARFPSERFRAIRNRAVLFLLLDTPSRRNEITRLKVADLNMDDGLIKVFGKGRRERWMPLGATAQEMLWDYLQARADVAGNKPELWLEEHGRAMKGPWLYCLLKRLGQRAGVPGLHTHRFRHTYAIKALVEGMPERVLAIVGGWKRIPDTYFRTLGMEEAIRFHRQISPADRLSQQSQEHPKGKKGRWRL